MRLNLLFALLIVMPVMAQNKPLDAHSRCDQSLAVVFSHKFTLCLPSPLFQQAAIAKADDLLIKFYDGSYFFGKILTPEMDALPADFDMRLYPEYASGMRPLSELPVEHAQKFQGLQEVLRGRMHDSKFTKTHSGDRTIYLMYEKESSEALVVSDDSSQILQLGFSKLSLEKVQRILKGVK